MRVYPRYIYPLLGRLEAEWVHERTLALLAMAQRTTPGPRLLRAIAGSVPSLPISLFGLSFPNILGVAAGFDKNARVVAGLALLGFGHVEVGTITPRPQAGNPRPRLFRLPADEAIINRMGFPNDGVNVIVSRLDSIARKKQNCILGISLGKQKETPLVEAAYDYTAVMRAVYPYADYLAVNVSSPNTPGLRELQGGDYLGHLLATLTRENQALAARYQLPTRPLLLKIAPDLSWPELDEILGAAQDNGVQGIIATNTTLERAGLTHPAQTESGGLSGRPLAQRSNEIIAYISRQTGGRLPVIGVGGVFTADDVRAKLDAGASLVQLYTGLVYQGPGGAGRILRSLAK
jgi:dihydroorotate dehydrogenase